MPKLARLTCLFLVALAAFGPLPHALAQPAAPMTDAERARRDAEKVFSFIKFQTVPAKPAEPAPRPARPAAASTAPPAAAAPPRAPEPVVAGAAAPAAPPIKPAAALAAAEALPALEHAALTAPAPTAAPLAAAVLNTLPATLPPEAEPEGDDADDGALQLQSFVAPVITPALQSTLGAGSRNVKVRFTVQANGRVSQADAAPGVPRRLARPAIDAVLQWQFAPLPQPRTVDVEIAFRRD